MIIDTSNSKMKGSSYTLSLNLKVRISWAKVASLPREFTNMKK